MTDGMIGFIVWVVCGLVFVGFGWYCFLAKGPVGFFANLKMFEVNDVRGYNRAMAALWIFYGNVFIALGFPLLAGGESALVLISIVGALVEVIAVIAVYILVIERKYRKR